MTNAAQNLISNQAALSFCMGEALEQVAGEIRTKTGSGTTAKAVELLMIRNANIKERVLQYASAAMVGVALAIAE